MIYILKNAINEGPGRIGYLLSKYQQEYKIIELSRGDRLPEKSNGVKAVIALGGPMNVYEQVKYPFIAAEESFIKSLVADKIPFLGICMGAQLLAKSCGADVRKAKEEEIGWYEIKLTPSGKVDRAFKGLGSRMEVFQWHGDTFNVPEKGSLLASSENGINQAFKVGSNAYGLQFHIEVTGLEIVEWIRNADRETGANVFHQMEYMVRHYNNIREKYDEQLETFFSNFLGIRKRL